MSRSSLVQFEKMASRNSQRVRNASAIKARAARARNSDSADSPEGRARAKRGASHSDKRVRAHWSRMGSDPNYARKIEKQRGVARRQKQYNKSAIGKFQHKSSFGFGGTRKMAGFGGAIWSKMQAAQKKATAWRKFL